MSQDQDQYYIDKVINGDTNAFVILVDQYKQMVFTLALRMLNNREEAEEVSQDVFLKVYGSLSKFKGDSKFSTWLYKIAYHSSLDYLKKRKRRIKTEAIDDYTVNKLVSYENSINPMEVAEDRMRIKKGIQELAGDDAVLITLHYFEELSLKEISKIVGSNVNTVKVRLFRARKKLAKILKYSLEPEIIQNYGNK
ncbi:MAG: RNA polymerase sigma factor [Flavobacteriaceae bacterium]